MTKLLPDTNVLVYETIEDSTRRADAARMLDSAREIILPSIVIHEYVWVMSTKLGVNSLIVAAKLKEYLEGPRTKVHSRAAPRAGQRPEDASPNLGRPQ